LYVAEVLVLVDEKYPVTSDVCPFKEVINVYADPLERYHEPDSDPKSGARCGNNSPPFLTPRSNSVAFPELSTVMARPADAKTPLPRVVPRLAGEVSFGPAKIDET